MRSYQRFNPATGESLEPLGCDDDKSIEEKYRAAMAAQEAWSDRPVGERIDLMRAFGDGKLIKSKTELDEGAFFASNQ